MQYEIIKVVEAKNITEAIKKEKEADIKSIEVIKENKNEQKYGFQL